MADHHNHSTPLQSAQHGLPQLTVDNAWVDEHGSNPNTSTVRVETITVDDYQDDTTVKSARRIDQTTTTSDKQKDDAKAATRLHADYVLSRSTRSSLGVPAGEAAMSRVSLDSLPPTPLPPSNDEKARRTASTGFHMLSWQRLASCLICEAVALGALSLPKVFSTLGMLPGIVLTIAMGFVSIHTALIVGEVKFRNPQLANYGEMGRLLFGSLGYRVVSTMFILLCILVTGGHVLTGVIAFRTFTDHKWCDAWYAVISALILFVLGLPKTFHQMAILAYVDFASITLAILFTVVVSAIESSHKFGGIMATEWFWILPLSRKSDFVTCIISLTNVALAYAYVQCLPSFMSEMRRPQDYKKAVWSLGVVQIVFYTLTGALIYAFKGTGVKAPALLNLEPTMQKIGFGIALPVIFVSGSINSQTAARFIYDRLFPIKSPHHYMNTKCGKLVWILLSVLITLIAWVAAEVIPSFETFLGLLAALFSAVFTFSLPALLYLKVLRYESPHSKNLMRMRFEIVLNVIIFAFGGFIFFVGSACCIVALAREYRYGISAPFAC